MTADNRFEHLIEPLVGPEPNTVPLTSVNLERLPGMVEEERAFDIVEDRAPIRSQPNFDQMVESTIQNLTDRERRVLQLRFGLKGNVQSLRGVAQELSMPKSTVFDTERRALRKLRNPSGARALRAYLG